MIALFRTNLLINSLLLLPYIFLIRLQSILNPLAYEPTLHDSPLTHFLYSYIPSPLAQAILAIFLVFFQSILVNRMCINNKLDFESSLVPGMLFALLCSLIPEFLVLSPQLISMSFLVLALFNALRVYNKPDPSVFNFNIGFYLAISGAIYSPYFIFIFFGLFSQFILRQYDIKEVLQQIFGVLSVLILISIYHFYNGDFINKMSRYFLFDIDFSYLSKLKLESILIFIIVIFTSLLAFINFGYLTLKKNLQVQKKIYIITWFLIIGLIGMVLFSADIKYTQVLMIPLGIFLAFILLKSKSALLPELVHISLLFILIFLHYKFLIG